MTRHFYRKAKAKLKARIQTWTVCRYCWKPERLRVFWSRWGGEPGCRCVWTGTSCWPGSSPAAWGWSVWWTIWQTPRCSGHRSLWACCRSGPPHRPEDTTQTGEEKKHSTQNTTRAENRPNPYQNGLQNSYCVLALKLLVVCEPVDQLHNERLKQLSGYLGEKKMF